jgi:hypothetical protein
MFFEKISSFSSLTQEKYNAFKAEPKHWISLGIGFFGITWCIYKAGVFNKITMFKVLSKQ